MRQSPQAFVALTLATTLIASPSGAQAITHGLSDCGTRAQVQYSVVFDASSSLRNELQTYSLHAYTDLLSLLGGTLCEGDLLRVFAFGQKDSDRMTPIETITAESREPLRLQAIANRALNTKTKHTDFHLVLRSIRSDLSFPGETHAVFLVTDGSFFPLFSPDTTVNTLKAQLDGLANFVQDSLGPYRGNLFVIGVNAQNVKAIDKDLGIAFPLAADARTWTRNGVNVDLKDDSGEDLLGALFGARYSRLDSFSLWRTLLGGSGAIWKEHLNYLDDATLLKEVSIEHILFIFDDPDGTRSCDAPAIHEFTSEVAEVRYGQHGRVLCSMVRPSEAELVAISSIASNVAFTQEHSLYPVNSLKAMNGLHNLVFWDGSRPCDPHVLRNYFSDGHSWPRTLPSVAQIELRNSESSGQILDLIRLENSGCIVPSILGERWAVPAGDYLLRVHHEKRTIFAGSFTQPRDSVITAFVRPGGFPFPSNRIALVRVCVLTRPSLQTEERMWVLLDRGKILPLTERRGKEKCDTAHGQGQSHVVVGFSGLVVLSNTGVRSARVILGRESTTHPADEPTWTPMLLSADGRLFLSWSHLVFWFGIGILIQLVFTACSKWQLKLERWWDIGALTVAVMSGVVVTVIAEFVMLVREADISEDKVPVIFALSVLAHMVKLIAAAMIPEHLAEAILTLDTEDQP